LTFFRHAIGGSRDDVRAERTQFRSIHVQGALELFAKRGLVPDRWYSDLSGPDRSDLSIDLQVSGLDEGQRNHIAHCMRALVGVDTVLMSIK